jgi:hypothetical protein
MNVKYFLTFSFSESSDINIDPHKVSEGSLQPCTETIINVRFEVFTAVTMKNGVFFIINMSLVDESQDSKEGKSVSKV